MLPLIVMSTVAGTANFAQSTFPSSIRPYVPQIIGAINLILNFNNYFFKIITDHGQPRNLLVVPGVTVPLSLSKSVNPKYFTVFGPA